MSCEYLRNDGKPCRCGELAIEDGVVVGHYDCVGPPGGTLQPLSCRICGQPAGNGALDPGRCAPCYNMGIVGFDQGRVLVEHHIQEFIVDMLGALGETRMLELKDWLWALTSASAASELGAKR